nr:retrovirus-related Pol polyprotein from transposon TNT 1-94 [Tanacetum cinerariifolium]
MIKSVYYVEGMNHNLFSVGQFCDADLEVGFRKSTCYIRDLKGNDLLTGSPGTDLYSITLQDTNCPNPICLMAKATSSQAWLWHRRLSYLNFDTINLLAKNDIVVGLSKLKFVKDHLCSSCELGKAKRKSFHTKLTPSSKRWSKDETPEVLIDFLRLVQRGLQAQVRVETMTTVNQGMSVEEIERVVAQRVANAIEAIAIYEPKTNLARKSMSQAEQQKEKVEENASNKRKWEEPSTARQEVKHWQSLHCKAWGEETLRRI